MIVDDSRPMRMILARALRQSGRDADVLEAEHGARGLEVLDADQVDLILSDWNMPEMDGLAFLQKVRARGIRTPFVFVTTEWTPAQREIAEASGATALLEKPFTAESLDVILRGAGC